MRIPIYSQDFPLPLPIQSEDTPRRVAHIPQPDSAIERATGKHMLAERRRSKRDDKAAVAAQDGRRDGRRAGVVDVDCAGGGAEDEGCAGGDGQEREERGGEGRGVDGRGGGRGGGGGGEEVVGVEVA